MIVIIIQHDLKVKKIIQGMKREILKKNVKKRSISENVQRGKGPELSNN
jgi:hypothetical protein